MKCLICIFISNIGPPSFYHRLHRTLIFLAIFDMSMYACLMILWGSLAFLVLIYWSHYFFNYIFTNYYHIACCYYVWLHSFWICVDLCNFFICVVKFEFKFFLYWVYSLFHYWIVNNEFGSGKVRKLSSEKIKWFFFQNTLFVMINCNLCHLFVIINNVHLLSIVRYEVSYSVWSCLSKWLATQS